MKLTRVFILLTTVILFSCSKENVQTEAESVNSKKDVGCCIYRADWDEWGRAAIENCGGWGLCNFSDCWMCEEAPQGVSSGIITINGTSGELTIELDPSETDQAEAIGSQLDLTIDEDIIEDAENDNYNTITIEAGIYAYNPYIGSNGGYILSLVVN